MEQRSRSFDVGEQHRHETRRERNRLVRAASGELALGLELTGDETDRHDPEAFGGFEKPGAGTVPRLVVLEVHPAEAGEGVADVGGVVDRQPALPTRVDVGEGAVGKPPALRGVELGHGSNCKWASVV